MVLEGQRWEKRSSVVLGDVRCLEIRELPLERNHGVSGVWDGDIVKKGNGSRDFVGAEEAEDSEHSKTSVVDLREKTLFLLLSGHVLTGRKRGTNILSFQKSVSKDDSVKTSPCWSQQGHKGLKRGGRHHGKERRKGIFQADGPWYSVARLHRRHTIEEKRNEKCQQCKSEHQQFFF